VALLGIRPQLVGHDSQLRDFLPHPLRGRVQSRHALSGVGILHISKASRHELADVELVQRTCLLDSPAQPKVSFLGQVLNEQGVHRALESDVQVRDVAFGNRYDVHASKG